MKFVLVTNQPRRAAMDFCGQWPAPAWLEIVSGAAEIFDIPHAAFAFALLYGEDVMRREDATKGFGRPARSRSDLALNLDVYRMFRAAAVDAGRGVPFGLTAEQFDKLAAWKRARQAPGVLAAFPPGLRDTAIMTDARDG